MKSFNVGIIGLGTVGGGVYKQLRKKSALITKRTGLTIRIKALCDTNKKAVAKLGIKPQLFVTDYRSVLEDPTIDCIVELVGGVRIAKKIIIEALAAGKDVVTANKALLAEHGQDIFKAARKNGRNIYFEASVAGGIPIIKGLRESLVSNQVSTILSIINGTCNYILTKMTRDGMGFDEALKRAQDEGFAEADPTLDIEGIDAAHKLTLLAELAFGKKVAFKKVSCEGITKITRGDIIFAEQLGYVVKLLAIAKKTKEGIEARVQPTLLSKNHILANVDDSYNAVYLMCDEVENMLFYGRGAGARPTASAVVSDIVDLARQSLGQSRLETLSALEPVDIKSMSSIQSRYFVRFSVIDKPGVLAKIASVLGKNNVSISDVIQQERKVGHVVPLVLLTHETYEKSIQHAVKSINSLSIIKDSTQLLRIEE
jgi:homoserine dehydrogenase